MYIWPRSGGVHSTTHGHSITIKLNEFNEFLNELNELAPAAVWTWAGRKGLSADDTALVTANTTPSSFTPPHTHTQALSADAP